MTITVPAVYGGRFHPYMHFLTGQLVRSSEYLIPEMGGTIEIVLRREKLESITIVVH